MSNSSSNEARRELLEFATARQEAARRLSIAGSLVLLTHDRPDGDGLGSMVALARSARLRGKTARLACADALPKRYAFLLEGEKLLGADAFAAAAEQADCVVVLDTCAWSQLEALGPALGAVLNKVVVIDHHRTRDDMGPVRWCDPSAAAVGVMVTELLERLGWPVDPPAAEAAVAAICSDTGWLRFSNTDARTLRAVAHWLEAGVDPAELYRKLYESDRPQRIALMARALGGMQLHGEGRIALLQITRSDFEHTGAEADETENLINEALRIGQVELAILLVENNGQTIRGSLRSKRRIDVAALAQQFGGGGHERAAGFRQPGPIDQLAGQVLDVALAALGQ